MNSAYDEFMAVVAQSSLGAASDQLEQMQHEAWQEEAAWQEGDAAWQEGDAEGLT